MDWTGLMKALGGAGQLAGGIGGLYGAIKTGGFMDDQMGLMKQQSANQQTLFDKQMQTQADAEAFDWSYTDNSTAVA